MSFLTFCLVFAAPNPKVELGRQLFFDTRLSADGSRSCYSCHKNEDGTGGHDPLAIGARDKKLTRHSPTLWNVGQLQRFYWDGRSATLEAQAKAAWAGGNMGMGNDNLAAKTQELAAIPGYKKAFEEAFPGETPTPDHVVAALSEFERTLVCDKTAFDLNKLNAEQKKGKALFEGKAGCNACHGAPTFSVAMGAPEGAYFNVGVGIEGKAEADVDIGRMSVTKKESDWAAFKVPTLRNISKSAPYFHDGSVSSLEEAVRYMAKGGTPNKNLSSLMQDRKLDDKEVKAIVSFLKALDCPGGIVEPKQKF